MKLENWAEPKVAKMAATKAESKVGNWARHLAATKVAPKVARSAATTAGSMVAMKLEN